ncbi:hypothetical protein Hanom_Chr04g00289331 [Helianthus anomalus]
MLFKRLSFEVGMMLVSCWEESVFDFTSEKASSVTSWLITVPPLLNPKSNVFG